MDIMDMDKILDNVLEDIKFSNNKNINKKNKTTLSKKNKNSIKKVEVVKLLPNSPPIESIKSIKSNESNESIKLNKSIKSNDNRSIKELVEDDDVDNSQLIELMLGNNLGKINNKNYKNMYYISHKILLNFVKKATEEGHNINDKFVDSFINDNFNDIMTNFINNLNKRNRKSLQDDLRCMGRKIDDQQCTRRKQDGYDYCQSHYKRLTNGRIDEDMKKAKKKNKRGRKRKVEFDPRVCDNDYVTVWADIVDGNKVLVDVNNNVYLFDVHNPTYIGKKSLDSSLIKVPYTEIKN